MINRNHIYIGRHLLVVTSTDLSGPYWHELWSAASLQHFTLTLYRVTVVKSDIYNKPQPAETLAQSFQNRLIARCTWLYWHVNIISLEFIQVTWSSKRCLNWVVTFDLIQCWSINALLDRTWLRITYYCIVIYIQFVCARIGYNNNLKTHTRVHWWNNLTSWEFCCRIVVHVLVIWKISFAITLFDHIPFCAYCSLIWIKKWTKLSSVFVWASMSFYDVLISCWGVSFFPLLINTYLISWGFSRDQILWVLYSFFKLFTFTANSSLMGNVTLSNWHIRVLVAPHNLEWILCDIFRPHCS